MYNSETAWMNTFRLKDPTFFLMFFFSVASSPTEKKNGLNASLKAQN